MLISRKKIILIIIFGFFTLLLFDFFTNYSIRIKSVVFLTFFLFIVFLRKNSYFHHNQKYDINDLSVGILLFFFVIILQNRLLNYEIISIDVPSYLVASQGVTFTNLPFESQWSPRVRYLYIFTNY